VKSLFSFACTTNIPVYSGRRRDRQFSGVIYKPLYVLFMYRVCTLTGSVRLHKCYRVMKAVAWERYP